MLANRVPFENWWKLATANERKALAKHCKTSVVSLLHVLRRRAASPCLADAIAVGTFAIRPDISPRVRKEQLATACSVCEYAKNQPWNKA